MAGQLFDYDGFIESFIANYQGDASPLGNAIGMLIVGRYCGWRVVRLLYSPATFFKYQKLLGIDFKSVVPEYGVYSRKSLGLRLLDKVNLFWDWVNHAIDSSSSGLKQKSRHFDVC